MAETQPLRLAADPGLRWPWTRDPRLGRLRNGAIIAAALIHAAVIAALLLDWPLLLAPATHERPPIPVRLVTVLPTPPKPPPKPQPKPSRVLHDLVSGPDQRTTAPPPAQVKGPQAAPKPEPKRAKTEALAPAKPKPPPPAAPARRKTVKQAKREIAPEPRKRVFVNRAPGEKERAGDPYLNRLQALIDSHRRYPANAVGPLGLHLQGVAVYIVTLTPTGALQNIRLERSSGSLILDNAARRMIERSAPFPPLPSYFPRQGATLTISIPLFPTAS